MTSSDKVIAIGIAGGSGAGKVMDIPKTLCMFLTLFNNHVEDNNIMTTMTLFLSHH